jgi:hypothetical protein
MEKNQTSKLVNEILQWILLKLFLDIKFEKDEFIAKC